MKKLILFSLMAVLLMSCGGAGQKPDDYITWGAAFNHVSHSFSYWLWIIVTIVVTAVYVYFTSKSKNGWDLGKTLVLFALLVLFMLAFFMRPSEVATGTTVEQAARGVYIGY